jgi:hypothetical protein
MPENPLTKGRSSQQEEAAIYSSGKSKGQPVECAGFRAVALFPSILILNLPKASDIPSSIRGRAPQ